MPARLQSIAGTVCRRTAETRTYVARIIHEFNRRYAARQLVLRAALAGLAEPPHRGQALSLPKKEIPALKKNQTILWIGVLLLLLVAVFLLRGRIHFDWHTFVTQLKRADWKLFGVGILLIWAGYVIRAVRWALFLKPTKRIGPFFLIGSQVIGFTAVALFGRLADLVRPLPGLSPHQYPSHLAGRRLHRRAHV